MPRYAIAYHSPGGSFLHKIVDLDTEESALRFFFNNYLDEQYTKDDEGYNYFSEDFHDPEGPLGSILEI
ncbi:hypothetical protein ACFL5V_05710 [Fibrobacterota bacterium]